MNVASVVDLAPTTDPLASICRELDKSGDGAGEACIAGNLEKPGDGASIWAAWLSETGHEKGCY